MGDLNEYRAAGVLTTDLPGEGAGEEGAVCSQALRAQFDAGDCAFEQRLAARSSNHGH